MKERLKTYREKNKEKQREWSKNWAKKNVEYILAKNRRAYQKHREKRAKRNLEYRHTHREQIARVSKEWRNNNQSKCLAQSRKRKAQKIKATPKWFKQERDKVDLIYVKAREFGFHVDHIVPLRSKKVCGLHTWANLQLLAPEINISKKNRYWPDMP